MARNDLGVILAVGFAFFTLVGCRVPGTHGDAGATGADTLRLVTLPAYRGIGDCTAETPARTPCRLTDQPNRAEAVRRLGNRTAAAWGDRDRWMIAYRAADDSVSGLDVMGGIQLPMSRFDSTRLWALALRLPGVDHAVISTNFFVRRGKQIQRDTVSIREWRGKNAPSKPATSDKLSGTLKVDSLWSDALQAWRRVTVYLPSGHGRTERIPVVYFADGQSVSGYARVIDNLIASGRMPPVALVGIWVSTGAPGGGPPMGVAQDLRSIEYHAGIETVPGADSAFVVARYRGHMKFFTEEVRKWAEESLFVSVTRRWRAVHGSSSGGHFALTVGRERSDLYGFVIANSNSVAAEPPTGGWRNAPTYYLSAGILEQPSILGSLTALGDSLENHGIPHVVNIYPSGHDSMVWRETLPIALDWWFATGAADR